MSSIAADPAHWLAVGQCAVTYMQADAETILAGFAFGTTQLRWSSKTAPSGSQSLRAEPRSAHRSRWAYRTYDCLPNSPHAFEVTDLLAAAALDANAGGEAYLAMEAILPDLNEALSHLDVTQTFWELRREHLGTTPPPTGTPEWWLWRTWLLLMGLDDVGVAIAYKTLHRKRPWFFPIFDNGTVAKMGGPRAWQVLHDELRGQSAQFTHLEQWLAAEAKNRGGAHLTRLRIHDILLWAADCRDALMRAGQDVLS